MNYIIHKSNLSISLRRFIFTSSSLQKQPPAARLKWKRKQFVPPFNRLPFLEDAPRLDKVEYPKVQPKYPSGNWGTMNKEKAWKIHKQRTSLHAFPTVYDKMLEFYCLEKNLWHHTVNTPLKFPEMLNFSQFLTQTKLLPEVPSSWTKKLDDSLLKPLVDQVQLTLSSKASFLEDKSSYEQLINPLMESIYTTLASHKAANHLSDVHLDENARVETFIKRSGYEVLRDEVNLTVLDEDDYIKFRLFGVNAWQMRSRDILPPFVDINDPVCTEGNIPMYNFNPEMFRMEPADCYNYQYTPFSISYHSTDFVRSIAGAWGRTPFWEGDPCEFGLLGTMKTGRTPEITKNFADHPDILYRHACAEGLLTAFSWTSAQAFNQGFTMFDDLKYPLTSQLILTDGRKVQLLAFQLNSVNALLKPQDAGLPFNLMWCTPEMQLFDHITERGEVIGLNPDTLDQIARLFLVQPMSMSSIDLRHPHLQDLPAPRDTHQFMGLVGEPEFTQGPLNVVSRSLRMAPRVKAIGRPHPNDVFFFKPIDQRTALAEVKETAPNFDPLPERYQKMADGCYKAFKERRGRYKTLRPPKRWQ